MSGKLRPGPGRNASSVADSLAEMMSDIAAETLLTQQISNVFQGDSGGPLMCLHEGHWTAIGGSQTHTHTHPNVCVDQNDTLSDCSDRCGVIWNWLWASAETWGLRPSLCLHILDRPDEAPFLLYKT